METGQILRQAREKKGLTLEQAEEKTKIRRKYIEALENEKYEVLPGSVYVKAFIKTYARYLDLNGDLLVEGLNNEIVDTGSASEDGEGIKSDTQETSRDRLAKRRSARKTEKKVSVSDSNIIPAKIRRYLTMAVGVVIVIALIWGISYRISSPFMAEKPNQAEQVKPENKDKETNRNEEQNTEMQKVVLKLDVTSDKSWMQVKVDGSTAFEGTLEEGQSKNFTAQDNMWVRLGNSGAVQVYVNGKNFGYIGKKGTVEDFTVDKQFSGIKKVNHQDKQTT